MTTKIRKYRGHKHGKQTIAYRQHIRAVLSQREREIANKLGASLANKRSQAAQHALQQRDAWSSPTSPKSPRTPLWKRFLHSLSNPPK